MVFFHMEDRDGFTKFTVNSYWWLYVAVTIPLTVVVGLTWYWMLKRQGYDKLQKLAMKTLDVEMNSNQPSPENSKSR
jgi:hypothetical protein